MTGAPWQKRNRPFPEKIEFLLSNNTHLQRPKSARHWSDQDTEVDTDTPVVRHNRLEEVIFVYAAMMFVLLSSLYQCGAHQCRALSISSEGGSVLRSASGRRKSAGCKLAMTRSDTRP